MCIYYIYIYFFFLYVHKIYKPVHVYIYITYTYSVYIYIYLPYIFKNQWMTIRKIPKEFPNSTPPSSAFGTVRLARHQERWACGWRARAGLVAGRGCWFATSEVLKLKVERKLNNLLVVGCCFFLFRLTCSFVFFLDPFGSFQKKGMQKFTSYILSFFQPCFFLIGGVTTKALYLFLPLFTYVFIFLFRHHYHPMYYSYHNQPTTNCFTVPHF